MDLFLLAFLLNVMKKTKLAWKISTMGTMKYILRWDDPELGLHLLSSEYLRTLWIHNKRTRHVRHWENEGFMTNNWVIINLIIEKKVNTKSKENPVWKITSHALKLNYVLQCNLIIKLKLPEFWTVKKLSFVQTTE